MKSALALLQKAASELDAKFTEADIPLNNFLNATKGFLANLKHLTSAKEIYSSLSRWFEEGYICQIDEFMLLNNGAIEHNYHLKEHESFLHTRPDCKHIYRSTVFSMCSADGIDYEYRRLADQELSNKQEAVVPCLLRFYH